MSEQRSIEVLGETIPVTLTRGLWLEARIGDEGFLARNVDELKAMLKKAIQSRRTESAIPVLLAHHGRYTRAVLRRRHATRRDTFMFDMPDGSAEAIVSPTIVCHGDLVTDAEIDELHGLVEAERVATAAARRKRQEFEVRSGHVNATSLLAAEMKKAKTA